MSIKGFIVSMLYDKELGEINQLINELKGRCERYHESNTKWRKTCEEQVAQIIVLEKTLETANKEVAFYKELVAKLINAMAVQGTSPIANGIDVEYPTPVKSENETLSVTKESIDADSDSNS